MGLWLITFALYLFALIAAIMLSVVASFFSTLPWVKGDGPGNAFLWLFMFVGEAALLVPICLAITGELVERKVQKRVFQWPRAVIRFALAFFIGTGPIVTFIIWATAPSSRLKSSTVWEIATFCISGVFVYFALRIRKVSADR
jgi:hypothetical protein